MPTIPPPSTSAPACDWRADRRVSRVATWGTGRSMSKPQKYRKGTGVSWKWGDNRAHGTVSESFTARVERQIKGNQVTRDADDDNPAYMVEQEDGSRALKSHSELKKES